MNETLRRAGTWVAEHEFWLLWVYGAPLLFASNLPLWLFFGSLLTIPFFWWARRLARGNWTYRTPLDLPLALLLVLGLVGVLVSNNLALSIRLYGELFGGIALYYGVVNGLSTARLLRDLWWVLALGTGMAVFGVLGLHYTDKFLPLLGIGNLLPKLDVTALNPRGFTPNVVAGAIAPIAPLAFAWAWSQTFIRRVLALSGGVLITIVVILTQSRGAMLGIIAALIAILIWRFPRAALLVPVLVVLVGAGLAVPTFRDQVLGVLDDPTSSLRGRIELWERAAFVMRDFPFTGIGLGTFDPTALALYPLFENKPGEPQPHVHNLYLQMGVDYGIGGLIAFLGVMTTTLLIGIRNARRFGRKQLGWVAIGLLASVLAFAGHGVLDAVFVSTKVSVGIWMILAFTMVLARSND